MAEPEVSTLDGIAAEEARRTLRRGARWLAALAVTGVVTTGALWLGRWVEGAEVPFGFTCGCLAYSSLTWLAADRNWVARRWVPYALATGPCLLPASLFVLGHFLSPAGAATWYFGPIPSLSFLVVIVAGFQFDRRLAYWSGAVAASGYLLTWYLAAPRLAQVETPHPVMKQELTLIYPHLFKAVLMLFAGLIVGTLTATARRLVHRVVAEEREKQGISRLFGQYVSPEVREKLVREKQDAIGERKAVVVLFSDLRDFTTISESVPPEQLVTQLNEYFDEMVCAIHLRGGTVDKFIGDALMVVFGGLLAIDDPSAAAVGAAQDMRARLKALNQRWAARGWPTLESGIGVHQGEVLQGSIGSRDRKEFTVIGDTVNTAARLEGTTKALGHAIVVSAAVHRDLPPAVKAQCVPLGPVALKGKGARGRGVRRPGRPRGSGRSYFEFPAPGAIVTPCPALTASTSRAHAITS